MALRPLLPLNLHLIFNPHRNLAVRECCVYMANNIWPSTCIGSDEASLMILRRLPAEGIFELNLVHIGIIVVITRRSVLD